MLTLNLFKKNLIEVSLDKDPILKISNKIGFDKLIPLVGINLNKTKNYEKSNSMLTSQFSFYNFM